MMKLGQKVKNFYRPLPILAICWFSFCWSWILITDSVTLSGSNTSGKFSVILAFLVQVLLSSWIVVFTWKQLDTFWKKQKNWQAIIVIFLFFALMDFIISWLVCLAWLGPQGSIDSVFTNGSPALLVINSPLRFAARIIGFYGLAAFLWTIIFLLTKRLWCPVLFVTTTLIVFALAGWGMYRTTSNSIKVKAVRETLNQRAPSVNPETAQLVVFPEYGFDDITNENLKKRISISNSQTSFVSSKQIYEKDLNGHINRQVFGTSQQGIISTQDKHRLVPSGEDASYIMRFFLRITNQKPALDHFNFSRQVIKGKIQLKVHHTASGLILGSGVCSSISSPEDYRYWTKNGATVLTNSASLDIFNGSRIYDWQQYTQAKFMSTANYRPFIQSANNAPAFILDSSGRTLNHTNQTGDISAEILPSYRKTLYTNFGEWPAYIGAILVIFYAARTIKIKLDS